MHPINKFYILLIVAVITAGGIFTVQLLNTQKITVKQSDTPLLSAGYFDIATENDDQILGNPGAPLTIVLFIDFNCPTCKIQYNKISKFVSEHPQDVRMYLKEIPQKNLFYKINDMPHRSAFCAGKQNKYWQYVDVLNNEKNISSESDLTKIANDLKINTVTWWQCVNSEEAKQKIARTTDLATSLNVTQVPTIYANNKKINLENDIDIIEMLTKFIAK